MVSRKSSLMRIALPIGWLLTLTANYVACGYPDAFADSHIVIDKSNPKIKYDHIEHLGQVKKLDTYLPASKLSNIATRFSIYNRRQQRHLDLEFKPASYQFDVNLLRSSGFDPDLRTIVIVAGYRESAHGLWLDQQTQLWLELEDVNVIQVGGGSSGIYSQAAANVPLVARQITILLYYLYAMHGRSLREAQVASRMHLLGHSLGAHICAFVGQDLGGALGRITGMDPAGPSFDKLPVEMRLDRRYAQFVDVIHTNSGKMHYLQLTMSAIAQYWHNLVSKYPLMRALAVGLGDYTGEGDTAWFGIDFNVGHVDYYSNNGKTQPGCDDLIHVCDHGRAPEIVTSILSYELALKRFANDSQMIGQLHDHHRLLAFKSADYESFLVGSNFRDNCPSLLADAAKFGLGTGREELDEAFRRCSVPIDLLASGGQLRKELASDYNLDMGNAPEMRTKFFFKTRIEQPYVGDHYLLRVRLDASSSWTPSCALKAELLMHAGETNSTFKINKQLNFVREPHLSSFSVAIPFVHPNGIEVREKLNAMLLGPIATNEAAPLRDFLIKSAAIRIMPKSISLSLMEADPTGVIESLEMRIIGNKTRTEDANNCKLGLLTVSVQPIWPFKHSVAGLFNSRPGAEQPFQLLNATELAKERDPLAEMRVRTPEELTIARGRVARVFDGLLIS